MDERLERQMRFSEEIDKEKRIMRQTYLTGGLERENDAEHAWHMAVMALVLSEYSNEQIDLLRVISMILIHDIVEIDAGDTYAYDEAAKKDQAERERKGADRLFGMLPEDQREHFYALWEEFEEGKTPEARFARAMDNVQPVMLNHLTGGKRWLEKNVKLSSILKRNENTHLGSEALWAYSRDNFIMPNVSSGKITDDTEKA